MTGISMAEYPVMAESAYFFAIRILLMGTTSRKAGIFYIVMMMEKPGTDRSHRRAGRHLNCPIRSLEYGAQAKCFIMKTSADMLSLDMEISLFTSPTVMMATYRMN